MPNYARGKIYKLTRSDSDDIYIGSTTEKYLSRRLAKHKTEYKGWKAGNYSYVTSFKLFELGADDVAIELIECCPCTCKEELCKKEGEHIKTTKCVNKYVAGRTPKEYREDNKEVVLKMYKNYREANKEAIAKYHKEHYEANKEAIAKYHKEHYKANKEVISKKHKEYYKANKAKLSQKVTCECGSVVCKYQLARHKKTKKHKKFISSSD